jgi:TRAP-type C4-dicarboxylate transport system permease small subunit
VFPRRGIGACARVAARLADAATQVLLVATVLVVAGTVVTRYGFGTTPAWAEEVALLFIIWFSFLGASLATREGLHLSVEFISDLLPSRPRSAVIALAQIAVVGFGLFMVTAGIGLVAATARQTLPATKLSVGYASYLALPVSGLLISLQAVAVRIGATPLQDEPPA